MSLQNSDGSGSSSLNTAEQYSSDEAGGQERVAARSSNRPRFEIVKVHAVALWSYDVKNDWCAICHCTINELCISCQTDDMKDVTKLDCPPAQGVCSHTFHDHCINRWLKTQRVCPLDNKQWKSQHSEKDS